MLRRRRPIRSARRLCLRRATAQTARPIVLGIRPEHVEAGGRSAGRRSRSSSRWAPTRSPGSGSATSRSRCDCRPSAPGSSPARSASRFGFRPTQLNLFDAATGTPTVIFQSTGNAHDADRWPFLSALQRPQLEPLEAQSSNCSPALGYTQVEGYGGLFDDPPRSRASSNAHGLSVPTAHVGLDRLRERSGAAVALCQDLGIQTIYRPAPPPGERDGGEAEWTALGRELDRIGKSVTAEGLKLRLAQPPLGVSPRRRRQDATSTSCSSGARLCCGKSTSPGWCAAAPIPVTELKRYASRITAVHVKDIAPAGQSVDEDGWADVGHGMLDWKTLLPVLKADGVTHVRGRARQAERCRTVRAPRFATVAVLDAEGAIDEGSWRRHHRLRQSSRPSTSEPRAAFAASRLVAVRRYSGSSPREARPTSSAFARCSIDELLRDPEIDVVVNLTTPNAHYEVSHAALTAGKHVFSEKPLCVTAEDGHRLVQEANRRGLQLGCAPDTFLGAGGPAGPRDRRWRQGRIRSWPAPAP